MLKKSFSIKMSCFMIMKHMIRKEKGNKLMALHSTTMNFQFFSEMPAGSLLIYSNEIQLL